jgi:hypothetical protein
MTTPDAATEALAEAWASIDGKLEQFRQCRDDGFAEEADGYYVGYLSDAEELRRRLEARGYVIRKARKL